MAQRRQEDVGRRDVVTDPLEESFAKLLGRQPTEAQRQELYRVRDALGIGSNDALWLVLMALGHYQDLYSRFPDAITRATKQAMAEARATAEAQARAATRTAHADLARAVGRAIDQIACTASRRKMFRWAAAYIAVALMCTTLVAGVAFDVGHTAGKSRACSIDRAHTPALHADELPLLLVRFRTVGNATFMRDASALETHMKAVSSPSMRRCLLRTAAALHIGFIRMIGRPRCVRTITPIP